MSLDNTQTPVDTDLIICRCERITRPQIQRAIHGNGAHTVNQVKKLTRAGMGPCQGRTCARVVEAVIIAETGKTPTSEYYLSRPPVRTVHLGQMATGADQFKEPKGPVSVAMLRVSRSKDE